MDPLIPPPVKAGIDIISFVKNSKVLQFALTLLVGVAIGALFYPTKHIEETVSKKYEQQISQLNTQHYAELASMKSSYDKQLSDSKTVIASSQKTITSLRSSVQQLKTASHYTDYKIVHPDGTIEEKKVLDKSSDDTSTVVSQVQAEYKTQLSAIETKYETLHQQRVQEISKSYDSQIATLKTTISSMQSTKVEDTNKKNYGIEAGALSNSSYYVHGNADVFGPVFIGIHGEAGSSNGIGAGLGLRF